MENLNQVLVNESIAVSCRRGESCVVPPDDAPVYAVVRIQNNAPQECVLKPDATWRHPCFYSGGIKVPCDQFREIINLLLRKYGSYSDSGVLYSIHCREFGLRWFVIFDSVWDGYCGDFAIVDVLDDCIYLL
jgi:hypothetical protein